MTFSSELAVWLLFCSAGLGTTILGLRLAHLVYEEVRRLPRIDRDVVDGAAHLQRAQVGRLAGWVLALAAGILTMLQPLPEATVGSASWQGLMIRWLLIGFVVIWSIETVSDYRFARKLWRRRKRR